MSTVHSIVHIFLRPFSHFADQALVSRINGVEGSSIGRIQKLVVDKELVGERQVHVIGSHRHCFIGELGYSADTTTDADYGTDEFLKGGGHVDVLALNVNTARGFLGGLNESVT